MKQQFLTIKQHSIFQPLSVGDLLTIRYNDFHQHGMGTDKELLRARKNDKWKHISNQNVFKAEVYEDKGYLTVLVTEDLSPEQVGEALRAVYEEKTKSWFQHPLAMSWYTPFDIMEKIWNHKTSHAKYDLINNRFLTPEFIHTQVQNAIKKKEDVGAWLTADYSTDNPQTSRETLELLLANGFNGALRNTKIPKESAIDYLNIQKKVNDKIAALGCIIDRDDINAEDADFFRQMYELSFEQMQKTQNKELWYYERIGHLSWNTNTPKDTAEKLITNHDIINKDGRDCGGTLNYCNILSNLAKFNPHLDMDMFTSILGKQGDCKKDIYAHAVLNQHATPEVYEFIDNNSFGLELELYLNPNVADSILDLASHATGRYYMDFARKNPKFQRMFPGCDGLHYQNVVKNGKYKDQTELLGQILQRIWGGNEH